MRKKIWVGAGDIILVSLRDYQDDKGDVILKYSAEEARLLKSMGELPDNVVVNEAMAGGGAWGGGAWGGGYVMVRVPYVASPSPPSPHHCRGRRRGGVRVRGHRRLLLRGRGGGRGRDLRWCACAPLGRPRPPRPVWEGGGVRPLRCAGSGAPSHPSPPGVAVVVADGKGLIVARQPPSPGGACRPLPRIDTLARPRAGRGNTPPRGPTRAGL